MKETDTVYSWMMMSNCLSEHFVQATIIIFIWHHKHIVDTLCEKRNRYVENSRPKWVLSFSILLWQLKTGPGTQVIATGYLNTADHRWQRSILGISWKDRVTNEEVRARTGQHSMDDILSERRLCWLGHVIRMDHRRIPRQALHWEATGFKRGPGRPRTNWRSAVNKDLLRMGITWEEVEGAVQNRSEWCRSVAQCIHLDAGCIKVKVTWFLQTGNAANHYCNDPDWR